MTNVRALVIDEISAARTISRLLEADGDISTVTSGQVSEVATEVSRHRPDVLVLVAASESGALQSIRQVMTKQPVPILLLTRSEMSRSKAIDAGAVDVMSSEQVGAEREAALRRRVKSLSRLKVGKPAARTVRAVSAWWEVVGIAASTGGPQALAAVLGGLTGIQGSVLVVQHIHPDFMAGFMGWMDRACPLPVGFATSGEVLRRGRVYIAPANVHLRLGTSRRLVLSETPETLHRPSADVLLTSIAEHAGRRGIGVLLTGMGDDGVEGLLAIRRAGGRTIAQDESSSAVYGMPRAAALAGAAERVLPLNRIAGAILKAAAVHAA